MGKRILIIDDDSLSRELLFSYLTGQDYELLEASNTAQARTIIHKENPDLILLDVMMPGEDGFSFCKIIKQSFQEPFLPVILVTALNDQKSRLEGLACGADDFLSKPLDRIELLIRVRNMLKIRELHADLFNELLFARRVQENLFHANNALNEQDKLFYQPCRQVGGDLIEIWEREDSRWAFLADASGHGPSAALIATAAKALLDKNCSNPSALLEHLNTKLFNLLANEDVTYYVTGVCVKIEKHLLTFAGAGHPAGFLKGKKGLTRLESRTIPLGIKALQPFEEQAFFCEQGDLLFLYSDGLFNIIPEERLDDLLKVTTTAKQIYKQLEPQIRENEPYDDISFLALTIP